MPPCAFARGSVHHSALGARIVSELGRSPAGPTLVVEVISPSTETYDQTAAAGSSGGWLPIESLGITLSLDRLFAGFAELP